MDEDIRKALAYIIDKLHQIELKNAKLEYAILDIAKKTETQVQNIEYNEKIHFRALEESAKRTIGEESEIISVLKNLRYIHK